MISTLLLTGGTGFIGSHLLERLLKEKYKVILIKRSNSDTWRINDLLSKCRVYDIDTESIETPFKENKVNCVVHMAAKYIKTHSTSEELKELISSNIIFSSILCEHAIKYNVPFFINTGSFFEYKIKNTPIDETDTLEPYNLYAATKIAFADILKFYTSKYKINTIDLKLFAPFGEKDNPKLFDLLMTSLLEGKELDFTGGEQKWDFTYVQDIVTSYIQSIKKIENLSGYNIFNIGSGRVHSIRDIVSFLEEVSGKKLHINWGIKPYAENEILYACSNNSKAKRILEWEPKYNIKSALTKLYKFYVSKDG